MGVSEQSLETAFLNNGIRYVTEARDLKDALTKIVAAAAATVGSECGSLYLLQSDGNLEPYILHNFPDDYLVGCKTVPLGTQCCGRAALHKVPWIVEDMWTDPLFVDCREAAKKAGMRSAISVPVLMADGRCVGTLASQFKEIYRPTEYSIERHRLFAQLIAFAIARDLEQTKRKPAQSAEYIAASGQIASD